MKLFTRKFWKRKIYQFFFFNSSTAGFFVCRCECMWSCVTCLFFFFRVSLIITYHVKHSQFYIKFDETYLLALNLACFFFLVGFKSFILVVICIRVQLFCFSFLCSSILPLFAGVYLALFLSSSSNSSSSVFFYFNCTALTSHCPRGSCLSKLLFIYTPLRLNWIIYVYYRY